MNPYQKAKNLEKRTGWTAQECLFLVATKNDAGIEEQIKLRRADEVWLAEQRELVRR